MPRAAELIRKRRESSWFLLISSFSTRLRSVMSLDMLLMPMTSPVASLIGDMVRLVSIRVPSLRTRNISMFTTSPPLIFSQL